MKKLLLSVFSLMLVITSIQAQVTKKQKEGDSKEMKIEFKIKDNPSTDNEKSKPKVYVDGKLFNFDISVIDQDMIESMNVLKGDEAITKYNAPQGVILIKTKLNSDGSKNTYSFNETEDSEQKEPLIIINGKIADKTTLKKLSPDDIEAIEVFKGEKAIKKYNAPNGAIVIKTKG